MLSLMAEWVMFGIACAVVTLVVAWGVSKEFEHKVRVFGVESPGSLSHSAYYCRVLPPAVYPNQSFVLELTPFPMVTHPPVQAYSRPMGQPLPTSEYYHLCIPLAHPL